MNNKVATREAYGKALAEFGVNEDIIVLDANLSKSTKTSIFKEKYPERFFNAGIAEANMVCVAAGLASCGKTVFVSSYAIFIAGRAYEQIRNSICYPEMNVKIGASHAGISMGQDGATHQSIEDIAIMRSLPNMKVISPCDEIESYGAVKAAIDNYGPFYLRFSRYPTRPIFNKNNYEFSLGRGVLLREGVDLTIIATGIMVEKALEAAGVLSSKGIYAEVINIHTIKPIDRQMIIASAQKTGAVLTVEEHSVIGGLGSAVAEVFAEENPVIMKIIGISDKFGTSGKADELLELYGLSVDNIVQQSQSLFAKKIPGQG